MLIDTHCHILSDYYDNILKLISDIKDKGVEKIIINGTDMKSNLEVLELVKLDDIVYGAIGFHPTELDGVGDNEFRWLEEHVNDKKIVAIGEIGLDYHYDNTDKNMQIYCFKRQLDIASRYNKPVIVHSRDVIGDTYDILSKYHLKGSIHAFSGSVEMADKFIKLNFYLGIGGVVTFKNAKNIVNVIKSVGLEYLLLETDSPYLAPVPLRGTINNPGNLPIIADKIADIKCVSRDMVIDITGENAYRLFDF